MLHPPHRHGGQRRRRDSQFSTRENDMSLVNDDDNQPNWQKSNPDESSQQNPCERALIRLLFFKHYRPLHYPKPYWKKQARGNASAAVVSESSESGSQQNR